MKSTTVLMVGFSFVAGLGIGMSGPLAKAGDGLFKVIFTQQTAFEHADRIAASVDTTRAAFQPADFRWPLQQATKTSVVCTPKDDTAPKPVTGIQHL